MRAVAFCLLALVVAASAREYPMSQFRSLLQTTALNCQADSSVSVNLVGSGSVEATATAFCQALADAEKVIESVVRNYFEEFTPDSSKGQCTEAEATEGVVGVAEAFASAFTKVSTEVNLVGTGDACASAFAEGDSLAVSLVQVYLQLCVKVIEEKFPDKGYHTDVAKKVDEKVNQATGGAVGTAAAAVVAQAWAGATSEACTTGGFKADFQQALVESTTTAIAELWATIIVELCSNFDDASKGELSEWAERTSESFSNLSGSVDVTGFVKIEATPGAAGSGIAEEIPPCTAGKGVCCNPPNRGLDTCSCGSGCTLTKGSGGAAGQTIWVDNALSDSRCLCTG